jgi:hypothetical protein
MVRFTGVVAALTLILGGCDPAPPPAPGGAPSTPGSADEPAEAQIYAAVIRRLVTRDHTYGSAESPFKHVYVVDGAIPGAGSVRVGLGPAPQPFPDDVKVAIAERLEDLPPLDFITNPDSVRLGPEGISGVRNRGVIISLGPLEEVQEEIEVSTGLWCGGTCGQWLTYVLTRQGDRWKITGTTGPYAIS